MALRVTVVAGADLTVIRVDGRLAGRGSDELERECRAAPRPVVLDLTHLASMDDAGRQLLQRLAGEGFHVVGASPYVAMLLAVAPPIPPAAPGRPAGAVPQSRRSRPRAPAGRRPSRNGTVSPPGPGAGRPGRP